ncbi:MAG: hypothetical protein JSR46_01065 [Verrucomicrobia bacterium]|nr:hypothetical protein [Verrucomicrobiota bacterium]
MKVLIVIKSLFLFCSLSYLTASFENERKYSYHNEELNSSKDYAPYAYSSDDDKIKFRKNINLFKSTSHSYCLEHCPSNNFSGIDKTLLSLLPSVAQSCEENECGIKSIYFGYIDPRFKRYSAHVTRQLEHYKQHKECTCYWPELSKKMAKISEEAYELFSQLFSSTALIDIASDNNIKDQFRNTSFSDFDFDDQVRFCVARQFRFSHYHRLVLDLQSLAKEHFSQEECSTIKNSSNLILSKLAISFVDHYKTCMEKHYNSAIQKELDFAQLFVPKLKDDYDLEGWEDTVDEFRNKPPYRRCVKQPEDYDERMESSVFYKFNPNRCGSQRLAYLNIYPLLADKFSVTKGQTVACSLILRNLIDALYSWTEFYKVAKKLVPDLESYCVDQISKDFYKAPGTKWSDCCAKEIIMIDFGEHLKEFRYKMFIGRDYMHPEMDFYAPPYYALHGFLTLQERSSFHLISIWLAPRPLLKAIFQDESVVSEIMTARQEIYEALERGDDRRVQQDELRNRFCRYIQGIDPKYIDFRANRVQPRD